MNNLYINGKFLVQRTTGVQRFARGLVTALDELLKTRLDLAAPVLLLPPGARRLPLYRIKQYECGISSTPLALWEQSSLPWAARNGALLCLTGSAPLLGRLCIPTIHDAAIYFYPKAYTWKFVFWYSLLFRVVSASAPITFTVSFNSARELEQFLPNGKFRVIPNAAEHILQQPADMSVLRTKELRRHKYLLAVGSQNPTKNLDVLVNAYRDSGLGPDIQLVLVGGQNDKVFARGMVDLTVPGLIFTGAINDGQLRALYENALALVFPSIYEGFGIPPLEAMACGCPVVASNASSIPEVCGDAALYFDPFDSHSIIKMLQVIVKQSDLRANLIKKGHARQLFYSWNHSAEILLKEILVLGLLVSNRQSSKT